MIKTDVIIIGGGPAGSSCAWRLKQHDIDCLVIDRQPFPRFKPCAGWITPEAVRDLALDPSQYPYSFTTFTSFQMSVKGLRFRLRTHQHAIRRIEFDDYLLKRSCAPVYTHAVKTIREEDGGYSIDGEFWGKYLVGAGGTYCPVYRELFKEDSPKDRGSLVAAQEEEFRYDYQDAQCYLWFLENNLPGYAWYVPKANGYLNVGVGGKADQLNANGDHLKRHWALLIEKLERMGLVRNHDYKPSAHTYYLRQKPAQVRRGNAFLVGDSAGLATLEMGEGIHPAVQSGLRAADAIITGGAYSLDGISKYSLPSLLRLPWRKR